MPMLMGRLVSSRIVVMACALSLMGACVGTGFGVPNDEPDPEAVPTTYDEIQTMIFDTMCAAQCHRGGAAPKGLSLEPMRSYRALVGVESVEVPGLFRVAPGQAEDSYLIIKLAVSDPRRVGSRMPRTGPPFASNRQIRAIKRWIRDGASEDWVDMGEGDGGAQDASVPEDASPKSGDATVTDAADAADAIDATDAI